MSPQDKTVVPTVPVTNALTAANASLPSYLTESTDGREQIDKDDLGIPRVAVMNALSNPVKTGAAKIGELIDSVSGNVLYRPGGPTFKGVFLGVHKMRIRWRGKGSDGSIECRSFDGRTAVESNGTCKGQATNQCALCEYAQFTKKDGKNIPPTCTEMRLFAFLADEYPLPLIVSLSKTGAKQGKKLVEKLNADMGMFGRPIYAFAYELSTRQVVANGNEWWELVVKPAGWPSEESFNRAKGLYTKYASALRRSAEENVAQEDSGGTAADESAPSI